MIHSDFRMNVGLGYRLIYFGECYEFRERRKSEIDWVSGVSRELLTLTDIQIHRMLSDGTCIMHIPGIDYDPETDLEIVGNPSKSDGSHSKREYGQKRRVDVANRLKGVDRLHYVQRFIDKGLHLSPTSNAAAELVEQIRSDREDVVAPSLSTIRRWLQRGNEHATAPRLSSRHDRKGNRSSRIGPEVLAVIEAEIAEKFLCPAPLPKAQLLSHIGHRINQLNLERDQNDKLDVPGEKALRNAIKRISNFEILSAQIGPTKAFTKEGYTVDLADPTAPLDRVEIDHTVFDIIVVDDENNLPLGRPTIALGIDRCTRMPYAVHVSFEPPALLTLMELLRNGILSKDYVDVKRNDADNPWNIKNDWPVAGIPRSLVVDLARENMSPALRDLAYKWHINEIHFMPGRKAWYKGGIERFIGTANRQIAHSTPGTTFSNVLQRGDYDSAGRAVVTLEHLMHGVHKWLIDIYQMWPHKGINNETPRAKWNRLIQKYPVTPLTDLRALEQVGSLGRSALRRNGISLENIKYNSRELDNYRLSPDCDKIRSSDDGKVEFLYDPKNLSSVRIVKHDGTVMYIPAVDKWQHYAAGISIWQHRVIKGFANKTALQAAKVEDLLKARVELYELMHSRVGVKRRGKKTGSIANSKKNARFQGKGRGAFSGNDTNTDAPSWIDSKIDAGRDNFPFLQIEPEGVADDEGHETEQHILELINDTTISELDWGFEGEKCDFDPYAEDDET